jgi:hypothetical protein
VAERSAEIRALNLLSTIVMAESRSLTVMATIRVHPRTNIEVTSIRYQRAFISVNVPDVSLKEYLIEEKPKIELIFTCFNTIYSMYT